MRKVLVRRVTALAVCAVGGAALYLAPMQLGDASSPLNQTHQTTPAPQNEASSSAIQSRQVSSAAPTLPSPSLHQDRTLPTPVRNLRLSSNTGQTYTLAWGPSRDAAGIRHYVVLANGFLVGRTHIPTITLVWQTTTHNILLQVAPIDGNGLQGEWRALMIVPPPLHAPSTTASAMPTPVPPSRRPSATPTPSGSPSKQPSPSPSPSVVPTSLDPCSTQDATPTATASTSQAPTATPSSPGATLSPSAPPSTTSVPTTSLSSEPGMPTTDGPTGVPSC